MALNIKDPETDRLARELADRMGTSITAALKAALQERLARTAPKVDLVYADLVAIGERGRRRPTLDERSAEEIVGYDGRGIPA
ncbi:type II toxin-antitoxin system VapB family antitoxin [Ruania albidiflava]|uniref:type II toxin-antitoxin system VapB family antitoxin n=1 Tax=Ruania albidiflava TaxID=366586 RepID=UPI0003B747C3|nr:type II toxin-antitoxin system VapB family antitoxin [Ruania albidiflava]